MATIYDLFVEKPDGTKQSMQEYEGSVIVIVNTASKCGFTDQFKELQQIYDDYREQGLIVLGFPSDNFNNQEFDSMDETLAFCERNYGVTFPMFKKVDVKGDQASPLFSFLTSQKRGLLTEGVKWNFTKFLINRKGDVVERFAPQTSPEKMRSSIDKIVQ
ncbi:glutathione peroxidase [Sporosarcina thermotolerans]|uniref:Glutathione peroxidase n=1 Tax=Sporosarcina thermotolerans TaxID=633404 RepID=A0AAW9ABJ1_9BACL|nr:glutathione peroxidase [Sporosarcina thermotolerans]MDW0118872.1 glutathione peroxidase [Sporosarcina thermotolerans]WHT48697.1 glutathione peroxidase [Sporosarcina thermotolerans]